MPPKFFFVPALGSSSTTRDRELHQADVRRHAATISHSRRPKNSPTTGRRRSTRPGSQADSRSARESTQTELVLRCLKLSNGSRAHTPTGDGEADHGLQLSIAKDSGRVEDDMYPELTAALMKANLHTALRIGLQTGALPVPILPIKPEYSASFYRAIEYFTRVLMPNNDAVYTIFDVSNVNSFRFLEILASSPSPYTMHSALALVHLVIGKVAPQTNSYQHALHHTGAALTLLRRAIRQYGDQSSDGAFVSVVCLAAFARAIGDYEAYYIHRRQLCAMTKMRGGLSRTGFQGYVRALALQFAPPDTIPLSLHFDRPSNRRTASQTPSSDPFFHEARHFSPSPTQNLRISHELAPIVARLPSGFQGLVQQGTLCTSTIELLGRIANARIRHASSSQHTQETQKSSVSWKPARYSDFWECCPSISRVGPDLEKHLCLSLLLYTANEYSPERAYNKGLALYGGPRAVLTSELGLLSSPALSEAERECLIWIWWVVIDSWCEGGTLTDDGLLLASQFWVVFPEPELRKWEGLRDILKGFFWGGRFEMAVERLFDAATAFISPPNAANDDTGQVTVS